VITPGSPPSADEVSRAISAPWSALGREWRASRTLRSEIAPRDKVFLRLNVSARGVKLEERGHILLTPSGMLDLSRARLRNRSEYLTCEGRILLAVEKLREAQAGRDIKLALEAPRSFSEWLARPGEVDLAGERLDAYAGALARKNGGHLQHAVLWMRMKAERVSLETGLGVSEVTEWAERWRASLP
jgi:hypothetical protein